MVTKNIVEGAYEYHKYRELEKLKPLWKSVWTMHPPQGEGLHVEGVPRCSPNKGKAPNQKGDN